LCKKQSPLYGAVQVSVRLYEVEEEMSYMTVPVPERFDLLAIHELHHSAANIKDILGALREDKVVLIRNVRSERADEIIRNIAEGFSVSERLALQAGFADFLGHRRRVGQYFMSVNKRADYQFISPHSEGTNLIGMQLASFYCYENSTDGGETILMNVNSASRSWSSIRESARRARIGPAGLPKHLSARAKGLYQLQLPNDTLKDGDQILREEETAIPGLTLVEVLAKPQQIYSQILQKNVYAYWDTIESIDADSVSEFEHMLRQAGLMREPVGGLPLRQLDYTADRRIWRSGVRYAELFNFKITYRLQPKDLIVLNNLTWTHAAANWSPNSGTREIAASFA
jgi:hypothetical protein